MTATTYHEYQAYRPAPAAADAAAPLGAGGTLAPTGSDVEGPFYRPGAPWRLRLSESPTLAITGRVLDTEGEPVVGAVLDFWQADEQGVYDNEGYTLRGRQHTDAEGRYALETVKPGHYPIDEDEFRCAHLHVKVSADGFLPLTTQLYFAGDQFNEQDHWFDKARVLDESFLGQATFDFVLAQASETAAGVGGSKMGDGEGGGGGEGPGNDNFRDDEGRRLELMQKLGDLVRSRFNGNPAACFAHYDRGNKDGKINSGELTELLQDAGVGNWITRPSWVRAIMAEADANRDGEITHQELEELTRRLPLD